MKERPLMNVMGSTVYPLGDKDPVPGNKDKEDNPKVENEHIEEP